MRFLPAVLLAAAVAATACHSDGDDKDASGAAGSKTSASPGAPAAAAPAEVVPVLATDAKRGNLPIELGAIGTVEAYATISIKPQVGGQIMQVHFAEGQDVKQGDVLFTIDPRPYQTALQTAIAARDKAQAQLRAAQANKARDAALARNAQADVTRYRSIPDKAAIAAETVEKAEATAQSQEAVVASDAAAIETAREDVRAANVAIDNAQLELSYCTIKAPLTGRTGDLMVDQGNIVKANPDNALVTINQLEPIYAAFTVPEQYLVDVRREMAKGPLQVSATLTHDENNPVTGTLTFIDNTVDRATGTIRFKATFDNHNHRLWPGQFADVKLRLGERQNVVTIPNSAILNGQQGSYVYIIKPDMTVANVPVKTGVIYGGTSEITQGLSGGERVVSDGQVRLRPGIKVEVKQSLLEAAGQATAGQTSSVNPDATALNPAAGTAANPSGSAQGSH